MTSDKHTRPYTNPGLRAVTSEICLGSARDEHGERALDSGFDGTASNPGVTCLFVCTCLRLLSCLLVIVAHVVGGVRSVLVAMECGSTGRPFSACRDCLAAENDILSGGVWIFSVWSAVKSIVQHPCCNVLHWDTSENLNIVSPFLPTFQALSLYVWFYLQCELWKQFRCKK